MGCTRHPAVFRGASAPSVCFAQRQTQEQSRQKREHISLYHSHKQFQSHNSHRAEPCRHAGQSNRPTPCGLGKAEQNEQLARHAMYGRVWGTTYILVAITITWLQSYGFLEKLQWSSCNNCKKA